MPENIKDTVVCLPCAS
uniref:Uncharacterized protein n=1 Tax=Arundo donax TaxID=35708 RepID=A0A0A9GV19_ARUDO